MDATYHFQVASGGSTPAGAQPNGNESTGEPLWVARTLGGTTGLPIVQLGKVRPGFGPAPTIRHGRCRCSWAGGPAPKNGQLVAKHGDLKVLRVRFGVERER
jgi:hypothetical protein